MLITKINPVGVDILIQKMQAYLHNGLAKKWGYANTGSGPELVERDHLFKAYGRAYRNQKDDGYVPEVYVGSKEYKEVFVDDTLNGLSFFLTGDTVREGFYNQVSIIYHVDLAKIKPNIEHRGDEEARVDAIELVRKNSFGFTLQGFVTGIENVYREFNRKEIKFRDIHPFHCFRINLSMIPIDKYC